MSERTLKINFFGFLISSGTSQCQDFRMNVGFGAVFAELNLMSLKLL